ncbi:MAG: hypothetical protein A3F70_09755 [Acidobacteria bacterium RIFCSPLOWO2_12_FULL_67_14]|nr:MAG: hypothetical protein A3H29_00825 [Acidobacteria bacterium RIFCSPLOWO2_02_FULL_67_21]OFW38037.1 MAG: hypothetical protein A3F70_09755 [Acidobacteria bacterium RIFCSPLOWO2_12_FULL_67_14]
MGGAVRTPLSLWGLLGGHGLLEEILDYAAVRAMARLPWTRRTWNEAAYTLVQNEATLDQLPPALKANAIVVNHGLFTHVDVTRKILDRRCLFVCSLESRKGPTLALHALAMCSSDLRLVVVGGGPARRRMERLARKLGLADRVEFIGPLPHAQALSMIANAAVALFTGLREEGGIALAEAIGCGTPVVVLAHGGAAVLASAAIDAERVVLVQPGSVLETARQMAEAMTRFARTDVVDYGDMLDHSMAVSVMQRIVSELSCPLILHCESNQARDQSDRAPAT